MFKDENRHYSLRKLSVGLASVLIGISFASTTGNSVHADTVESGSNSAQTVVKGSDTAAKIGAKDDANVAKSNTESADEATKKDPNAIAQDIKQKAIKASEAVTKLQDAAETIAKGNAPEAAAKNATDGGQAAVKSATESTLKGANLIAKQQNTAVKDNADADKDDSSNVAEKDSLTAKNNALKATVEAAKQGLETPAVQHSDGNETTLNVKGSNAITENMLKEDKDNQAGADPAKSKLKLAALTTTTGKKFNAQMLSASKVISPTNDTNGGFDEATWGKLNVNDWKGSVQGDYYQLTDYTGDANHVIVPNEADFAKAGISTSGKQVGVTSSLMHSIFKDKATTQDATVAFSKTDNKMVKAINADWNDTWGHNYSNDSKAKLSKFDGTNLDVSNVTYMQNMFNDNQISDLSSLANWNVDQVTNMAGMFFRNQISDLSPLANWNVDQVTNMGVMFQHNQISDLSPLANWNVDRVIVTFSMFSDNSSLQITNLQAKRIINFVYPDGYTGKKQDPVTQTVDVPQQVKVELTTGFSKPSNNILDWVTKTETPISTPIDPVYFPDYTVPEIKGLLEPDKTVISREQADITKPINVTVTYKLVDSNTNDAYALDSKNGLHEHANVNDNGGYDSDFWGKINVDDWNYTVNGDSIKINSLKDSASTGVNDAVIVPNLDDFKLAGKDGGAKTVYISSSALGETAKHKYYGLSKTNGNTFATGSDISNAFNNSNLTHADLNSLNTSNVTEMHGMFRGASSLTSLDVSNWDTGSVTDMGYMFNNASGLTSLDVSNWDTSKVTNMSCMFRNASSLTSLDVSNWDTNNVTNMSVMFYNASSLTSLDVSNWKTGKVTDMSSMFYEASGLTTLDVSKWDTGKVTDIGGMFSWASNLTILDVSKWDTSKATDMRYMFNGASSLTDLDVSHWDTSKVTDMNHMFNSASGLTDLDVSHWDTGNVTNMSYMFDNARSLALIINGDKFADYLVKNNFAYSGINSSVKSVTTDNAKLLQLLTSDVQHDSSTRTITFTFPANYSPDLTKYHLTKVGSTYQIKQSADYAKSYAQGTVLINGTDNIAKHHIDTTKKNKLSDTWQPNYDKLVLAHKNADGTVSFDDVQLPQIPGYKTVANLVNPARALFAVSFMALPKPVASVLNDAKPAETVSPATPVAIEVAKPIKTEPKVATTPKVIDLSADVVATTLKETTWHVADEPDQDTYRVSNGQYAVELPHISNAQLHVIANDSTKDSILFTYKGQNSKYAFKIKFADGHYLLTTYEIKSGKLVKLIDYNFTKSSKMINVILDWLQLK